MKYLYNVKESRGELRFSLVDPETKNESWSQCYPSFTEDVRTGELVEDMTLIDLGVMSSIYDTAGLEKYLKECTVLNDGDSVSLNPLSVELPASSGPSVVLPEGVKLEDGGKVSDLSGASKYFCEYFIKNHIGRKELYENNPKYQQQIDGLKEAVDKGYLFLEEKTGYTIVRAKQKLADLYKYAEGGKPVGSTGLYAKGGEVSEEAMAMGFRPARHAKGKIAYHAPARTDGSNWKSNEMKLAEAKGVNGKWSHRENAYIMSPGQAETLRKYINEGYEGSYFNGEVTKSEEKKPTDYTASIKYYTDRYDREIESGESTKAEIVSQIKNELAEHKKVSPTNRLENYDKKMAVYEGMLQHFSEKEPAKDEKPATPRSKQSVEADKKLKALHPGKRISEDGNTYYESRANRSDVNRTKKFAEGGRPSEKMSFLDFMESKGYTRYYKSNRPIARYDQSGSQRISNKQYDELEKEYELLVSTGSVKKKSFSEGGKIGNNVSSSVISILENNFPSVISKDNCDEILEALRQPFYSVDNDVTNKNWTDRVYFGMSEEEARSEMDHVNDEYVHHEQVNTLSKESPQLDEDSVKEFIGLCETLTEEEFEEKFSSLEDVMNFLQYDLSEREQIDSAEVGGEKEEYEIAEEIKNDLEKEVRSTVSDLCDKQQVAGFIGSTFYGLKKYKDGYIQIRVGDHFFNPSNIMIGLKKPWITIEAGSNFNEYENIYGFISINIINDLWPGNNRKTKDFRSETREKINTIQSAKLPYLIDYETYGSKDFVDGDEQASGIFETIESDLLEKIEEMELEIDKALEINLYNSDKIDLY